MKIDLHAVPYENDGHKMVRIEQIVDIIRPVSPEHIDVKRVKALWDTGATNTYIPMQTAVELGIPLGDEVPVRMGSSSGKSRFCKFFLGFPTGDILPVTEGVAVPDMKTNLVIGMDVISKGWTQIVPDGHGGVFFSFEKSEGA